MKIKSKSKSNFQLVSANFRFRAEWKKAELIHIKYFCKPKTQWRTAFQQHTQELLKGN